MAAAGSIPAAAAGSRRPTCDGGGARRAATPAGTGPEFRREIPATDRSGTAPDAGLTSRLPTDSSSDTEQCASRESFCRVTFRSSQFSPSGALTVARRAARAAAGGDWPRPPPARRATRHTRTPPRPEASDPHFFRENLANPAPPTSPSIRCDRAARPIAARALRQHSSRACIEMHDEMMSRHGSGSSGSRGTGSDASAARGRRGAPQTGRWPRPAAGGLARPAAGAVARLGLERRASSMFRFELFREASFTM